MPDQPINWIKWSIEAIVKDAVIDDMDGHELADAKEICNSVAAVAIKLYENLTVDLLLLVIRDKIGNNETVLSALDALIVALKLSEN